MAKIGVFARIAFILLQASQAHAIPPYVCYGLEDVKLQDSRLHQSITDLSTSGESEKEGVYRLDIIGGKITLDANTGCKMSVVAVGERGSTRVLHVNVREKSPSRSETLYIKMSDIGALEFVRIEASTYPPCPWHPVAVEIQHDHNGYSQLLACSQSAARVRRAVSRSMAVEVVTYDQNWAGTDANIFIQIIGKTGQTGEHSLTGEFEVGTTDTNTVTFTEDIGIITQIRIGHDDTGSSSGWKLDKVTIRETGEGTYTFQLQDWIEDPDLSKTINIETAVCTDMLYCVSQKCVTCNACADSDGTHFYALKSDNKECFRCSHIDMCEVEECPSNDGQTCSRCEGVVSDSPGLRAYIPAEDKKSCIMACSWRSDSKWCYPGSCPEEFVTSCECSEGFTGDNCDTITEKPTILWNHLLFSRTLTDTTEAPLDPNTVTVQEQSWTNMKDIQTVEMDFKSTYIQSGTLPTKPPYIEGYKVGIISGTVDFRFFRGGSEDTSRQTSLDCGGVSTSDPNQSIFKCLIEHSIPDLTPTPLMTGDRLQFEYVTENGGSVGVRDKETDALNTYEYTGEAVTATVKMGIDYVSPFHCVDTGCTDSLLRVVAVTMQTTVSLAWDGWQDALSGLHHFEVTVFELDYIISDSGLRNKRLELMQDFNSSLKQGDITIGEKGIYSVELAAYDKAGNYRISRRIMIYDEETEVTTVYGTVLRVTSAAGLSAWEWQWTSESVTVDWNSRYINVLHDDKKWLEVVLPAPDVDSAYDDNAFARGVDPIPNVQAIVEFRTAFLTDHAGGSTITTTPDDSAFTSQGLNQLETISPTLVDGDTLRYWIRAFDYRGEHLEEELTVHIDTSPPIIQNLWLTKGDRLNVNVHRIEELSTMTIEWESYDDHSGLETVFWRLFDNYTGIDIIHGIQHITAQGDAADISACNSKYGSYPRGSNCYCTPGVGCYHRHYQVKPPVIVDTLSHGGVFQSKDRGVHDFDYFLEVTVMNHAHLTSILDFKVTVDASPPHPGVVHDGQNTEPEVDYQSSLQLHAHWDGFFDKESGVKFYQYGFADHCLQPSDFALDLTTVQVTETFSTHASWTAPSPGKFYMTVVAYNRALEPSSPVCSDGVTVDQTGPVLSQISVLNSRTTEGLIKTAAAEVWLISSDRRRSKVEEPDNSCIQNAMEISDGDLLLLPQHIFANGTNMIHPASACSGYQAYSLADVKTFYLSKDQVLYVNWTSEDTESHIYNYQLGLMNNPSDVSSPDIQPFTSTHHHAHYMGFHPPLSEGKQFHIAVKAINIAGLSSTEVLGPVTVHTQPPSFTGTISVRLQKPHLVASWTTTSFTDPEQGYLQYEFAIGSSPGGTEVLPFGPLQTGGSCSSSTPPSCTAVNIADLHWDLHHSHTYYVAIKVTNIVGLFTVIISDPYRHNVRVPSLGVVLDISPQTERTLFDITEFEDTDFQLSTITLEARWYGFDDGLSGVTYRVCIGTAAGLEDVRGYEDVGGELSHQFDSLILQVNQKYFISVVATNDAGNQLQSSDGVTIIENNVDMIGITVKDGDECGLTPGCVDDIQYQSSISTFSAHWTSTSQQQQLYPECNIRLERKVPHAADVWTGIGDYENHGLAQHVKLGGLPLDPGHTYRTDVKFCAVNVCTNPVYSDGVTVMSHPPVSGNISVTYTEQGVESRMDVTMDQYSDPDIPDMEESYDAMDRYEWSLTDNSHSASLLIHWTLADNTVTDQNKVTFSIELPKHLTFTKCHRVAVRGYNKVGLYTIVSTDVKDCDAINPLLIVPATVMDALGSRGEVADTGHGITLKENARWDVVDADYTPYKNVLSAVWPSLRHHKYIWAVLVGGDSVDPAYHFKRESLLTVANPCDSPMQIKCGNTDKEFINVYFNDTGFLQHGKRYYICIHADETLVHYEKFDPVLPEINVCSDGVTVDLTPPSGGTVTVQGLKDGLYQVSKSEVDLHWNSFTDVEESGLSPHPSGISNYQVALGSVPEGEDIQAMTDVGLVNHFTVSGLTLHDGMTVFATVMATDFVKKTHRASSNGFVIDASPPVKTGRQIKLEGRYVTTSVIDVCWEGVLHDQHSGIKYYYVSFGSRPEQADIVPQTQVEDVCGQFDTESSIHDGHSFYINVKAYNGAGLSTTTSSHALYVDTTPPSVGHVYDGKLADAAEGAMDKDYITNIADMGAHWEGFADPNSPISFYLVKVGSCPGCEDTVMEYEAAARTDVVFMDRHTLFAEGIIYYVTVTACNKAGLCSSATSDGVILDQSPPVPGRVQDGTNDRDIQYQASRTFLGSKWHGFQDPESDLGYYEWWVGTTPGGQNVLPPTHAALEEIAFHILTSSSLLTAGTELFVTVKAYNKAGLSSVSVSNGFVIDDTAPVVVKSPVIEGGQGSLVAMTLMSRTTVRISWEMKDDQSFIEKQYISISSHELGEFDSSPLKLPGLLREFTYTRLDLHDGSKYMVKVTACNMAGMCTTTDTGDILVDGSKPHTGTLAVKTDHAARLTRHQSNAMTWTGTSLTLAWLGFADLHSGIDHYIVTVGSKSFGTDLAFDELPSTAEHSPTGVSKDDEGVVQVFTVNTKDISSLPSVFVAIWAVNGVGLKSSPLHSELVLGAGGQLELVRRCSPYNCQGHCVCAVQDKKCALSNGCTELTEGGSNAVVTVTDVISLTSLDPVTAVDVDFSPSDTFLAATWRVTTSQGLQPVRYEFGAGLSDFNTPKGIYNVATERVWFDAGTQFAIVVLEKGAGHDLTPGLRYSVFVRAWYDDNTYSIFKTDGVLIDNTRPTFTTNIGMAVKEHKTDSGGKDVDFQSFTNTMYISWGGKFLPGHSGLLKYRVYVSTSPGGHNIHDSADVTATSYTVSDLNLETATLYFSSVLAYNKAGLVGWEYSDGVQPDSSKPVAGSVQDGNELHDIDYQSSPTDISASWFGFTDTDSTIVQYFWCVGTVSNTDDCSLMAWQDVGLHTSGQTKLDTAIPSGSQIWTKVYAKDVTGNTSPVSVSDGVIIDTSPPTIKDIVYLGENLVVNPSFEDDGITAPTTEVACNHLIPVSWEAGVESCIKVITPEAPNAKHEKSHLVLSGSIKQSIVGLVIGRSYLLTLHAGYPESLTVNHKAVEASVAVGREVVTLSLDPSLCKGTCQVDEQSYILWSTHKYNFVAEAVSVDLQIATPSRNMEVVVDHVSVQLVENSGDTSMETEGHLTLHPVFLPHWSSVHASWYFTDDNSPITEYTWAAGTVPGGTQVQKFVSVGRHTHGTLSGLKLTHKQQLYLTITARNAAGLTTISHPDPITVDMTAPIFTSIIDGTDTDIDYRKVGEIHVTWVAADEESGLHHCDWAIGTTPGASDAKKFEMVPTGETTAKFDFTDVLTSSSLKVFSTVRCFNWMGHMATATTDGITVIRVDTPPSVKGLEVLEDQVPYLYGRGQCQSSKDVRLKWTRDELQSTAIEITDESNSFQPTVPSQYTFALMSGLQVHNLTTYHMDVFPKPIIGVTVGTTPLNFTLHGPSPKVSETEIIKVTRSGDRFTLSWSDVFISPWSDLQYAVHVGTALGGGDIQLRTLQKDSKIHLTVASVPARRLVAYISVTAIDPCGYTNHISQSFNIEP